MKLKPLIFATLVTFTTFSCGQKQPVQNNLETGADTLVQETAPPVSDVDESTETEMPVRSEHLQLYLDEVKEKWKDIPNPFVALFDGYMVGDYEHLLFEDENGNQLDFGDGKNTFGTFSGEDIMNEESPYAGKKFKVTWAWKLSRFYCCDGEMNLAEAEMPSIVSLELIK